MNKKMPVVMALSGHDPSGGAGVQADIETLFALKCHACSVITALTDQDTKNVIKVYPQNPDQVARQFDTVMQDLTVDAIKIGLVGHVETALVISERLSKFPKIPVVLDPILMSGGGRSLSNPDLIDIMNSKLFPRTSILTPNSNEARILAYGETDLDACARYILKTGCQHILITGTHEIEDRVVNRFYGSADPIKCFEWPRLPYSYHGSGCTLAASIAGYIALGLDMAGAVTRGQDYSWRTLKHGFRPGAGQHVPDRRSH